VVTSSGTLAVGRLAPGILRAAGLGSRCPVDSVTRLAGGSKKGVYRLGCSGGFSAVLYVWSAAEDFWPAAGDGGADAGAGADVFGHASGLGLFSAASQRLTEAGVRVPVVYLTDASQALYPADIALVEDVRGGTLEELLAADPSAAAPVMERLGEMLRSMWGQRAARVGRVADVAEFGGRETGGPGVTGVPGVTGGPGTLGASSELIVLERALRQLAGAADRVPSVATAAPRLDETLRALAASVRPRASYGLIHGELGPDHVSIDDRGQPVVVDIEGAMYFDVEWEHAFLRLRFGRDYEWLRVSGLDERRMSLYALALDLSLIEGPLRLLDGDYPDREEMLAIAGWAVDRVLRTADADRQALSGAIRVTTGRGGTCRRG
jgi:Phosphotransferase enzyme family